MRKVATAALLGVCALASIWSLIVLVAVLTTDEVTYVAPAFIILALVIAVASGWGAVKIKAGRRDD